MNDRKQLDQKLSALLCKAADAPQGKQYWRSLEELADSTQFQEMMRLEFPAQADVWPDAISRRRFLSLMAASLGLAGVGGCSVKPAPAKKIVPYVRSPRDIVPGEPLFFATAMPFAQSAVGLLVESHMGRPTKIEGNPDHPESLGSTSVFHQASILTLYDPDRSQMVTNFGRNRTWDDAFAVLRSAMSAARNNKGAGLRILSEPIISPTLADLRQKLLSALPEAKWHVYQPLSRDEPYAGSQLAFGRHLDARYDFQKADVVVSLDADFLSCGPGHLRYVRDFMSRRRVTETDDARTKGMNRLYVAESLVSTTGAKADHRLVVRSSQIGALAGALAAKLSVHDQRGLLPIPEKQLQAIADDLLQHRGRSIVLAGQNQPPSVHLLTHAINQQLGNFGHTVFCIDPIEDQPTNVMESLRELTDDLQRSRVQTLIILGGNPVYTAPADIPFGEYIQSAPLRLHLGTYQDETARLCHWHLPEAYYLESWGDARAYDGTVSIIQPLIEPLYRGRSAIELASYMLQLSETPGDVVVRRYWRSHWTNRNSAGRFSDFWRKSLHDGVVADTAFPEQKVSLQPNWQSHLEKEARARGAVTSEDAPNESSRSSSNLEVVFRPSSTVYDGCFANNGWLQELPEPMTKLTWDNAALMSPATARSLEIKFGSYAHGGEHGGYQMQVVELQLGQRTLRLPAWIVPGQADGVIGVWLGYGRGAAGRVGGTSDHPVGSNGYLLRTSAQLLFATGLKVSKTGASHLVACTQQHHLMENRNIIRAGTLNEFETNPEFATEPFRRKRLEETAQAAEPLDFYPPRDYSAASHKWGMSINLGTCVGCNACVVACQAENNIPVVGKEQVAAGREMHWIRIDRYIQGPMDQPEEFHVQPVPCMHCEHAPCEYVCPVAATVHSAEGLNDMVYNRCVGTRFCSNNCPYKVRRFNFLAYADFESPLQSLQYNPDVTVRSRGVMEKCSYCVQRIRHAEIKSLAEGRSIADGEVITACQAACPAQAIVFGDLNDSASEVAKLKQSPLNYGLLEDLNTVPRTTYVAALRNPNPAWKEL